MPTTELVDVVDEGDFPVGVASLEACLAGGLLHRAVAVVVVRPGGRIMLQQRSRSDPWHPGKWTLSCTGHVKKGETYHLAARRELFEELGVRSPVRRIAKLLLPKIRSRGRTEREWTALFVSKTDMSARIDPAELEGVQDCDAKGVRQLMASTRITPDARILLGKYLRLTGDYPGPG